jgi:hypothetical protein
MVLKFLQECFVLEFQLVNVLGDWQKLLLKHQLVMCFAIKVVDLQWKAKNKF